MYQKFLIFSNEGFPCGEDDLQPLRAIGSLLQSLHIEDFHLVTLTTLLVPRSTWGLGDFFVRSFTSCPVRNPTGKLCGTARAYLYTVDRATVDFRQLAVSSQLDSITRITTTCELKVLTGFTYLILRWPDSCTGVYRGFAFTHTTLSQVALSHFTLLLFLYRFPEPYISHAIWMRQ